MKPPQFPTSFRGQVNGTSNITAPVPEQAQIPGPVVSVLWRSRCTGSNSIEECGSLEVSAFTSSRLAMLLSLPGALELSATALGHTEVLARALQEEAAVDGNLSGASRLRGCLKNSETYPKNVNALPNVAMA